jgi:hypothetical protein
VIAIVTVAELKGEARLLVRQGAVDPEDGVFEPVQRDVLLEAREIGGLGFDGDCGV